MFDRFGRGLYLQALLAIACVAVVSQLPPSAEAGTSDPPPWGTTQPWIMPQAIYDDTTSVPPTAEDWLRFGWDTFIAMNWPHLEGGNPGQPDSSRDIVTSYNSPANYPDTAWWTYNGKFQLFYNYPSDGQQPTHAELNPGDWDTPLSPKPMANGHQVFGNFAMSGSLSNRLRDQLDEAFIDAPLIDRNGNFVFYQIFVNQSFWQYAINTGYFDGTWQNKDVKDGTFIGMPKYGNSMDESGTGAPWYGNLPDYAQQGAMSVKVAWKQLDETEIDSGRYYTREAYYENNTLDPTDFCSGETGEPITVGLVGMHILRLTPTTGTTWFWSSFEHVDNVTGPNASFNAGCAAATSGYTRRGTCTDAVPDIETDPWLPEYPPLNPAEVDINGNPINYPDGLCGPQDSSSISQIFRIQETQANLDSSPISSVNDEYQTALAGTPWQYYEQINTTQPRNQTKDSTCDCFVAPDPTNKVNTCDMTNTSMESYSQYNFLSNAAPESELAPISNFDNRQAMNCINCHAFSAPVGTPTLVYGNTIEPTWAGVPTSNSLQVFTFLLGGATLSCSTDINLDTTVNTDDLLPLMDGWGVCQGHYCNHDVNQDGVTDITDLLMVLSDWGGCSD
jgi:hypothetical protein